MNPEYIPFKTLELSCSRQQKRNLFQYSRLPAFLNFWYVAGFSLLIFLLFHLSPVGAQSARNDSLVTYMELGARNNPLVLQRFSEYQAALQKVLQAGSLPDPELSLGVFLKPMEIISGKQVADIKLMQMFPWFGVLKNARDEMSLMAKAKFESFRDAKLGVYFDVQQNWYELMRLRENVAVSENNLAILKTLETLSLVRFRASGTGSSSSGSMQNASPRTPTPSNGGMQSMGSSSRNLQEPSSGQSGKSTSGGSMTSTEGQSGLADVYRIQIEIGNLENDIEALRDQQNTTLARFNALLNRSPLTPVALPDSMNSEMLNVALPAVSDSMLAMNPMLGMLRYEQRSIEAKQKMVKRMGLPMIGLGLDYSLISTSSMSTSPMNGNDMLMPMVSITLPIYRKKYKAMQQETEWLQKANDQQMQSTVNELQIQYYEAIQKYRDAGRRMVLFRKQADITGKTYAIMLKSYASDGTGLSGILDISRQLLDYRYKEVEALADYNTAVALLKRLMASSSFD